MLRMMGVILFFETARKNSSTGRRIVHALICSEDFSNDWKASLRMGIRVAGSVVFASKIVETTKGGTNKMFLQRSLEGLVAVSVSASTASFVSALLVHSSGGLLPRDR